MSKIWRLFRFSGHARRGEYWLITILANIGLIMPVLVFGRQTSDVSGSVPNINVAINLESGAPEAALLVTLVSFALGLAVSARRLHDRGKSAWWLLLFYVVPFALALATQWAAQRQASAILSITTLLIIALFVWAIVELGVLRGVDRWNAHGVNAHSRAGADTFD